MALKLIQGKQINVNLTGSFTGSFTGDGSGLTNLPVQNIDTGSLVTTSSFNAFTSSYNTGSFTGSFSGSLFGTASFAEQASTASFAPNYLPLTGGTINGDITVNGTASIAFLNVTIESASVIYSSGSNQFGDATNDTQTLIGTVIVSGSQQITGSLNVSQGITSSLFGTSSWASNSLTASFVTGSNVFGPFGSNSIVSSSIAISSSFATTASFAISSSRAVTSSFAISSSFAATAEFAQQAESANNSINSQNTNVLNGFQAATVQQINVGQTNNGDYAYIVRAQELEQSKHTTVNIYNNLNFT